ncbi:MAG TPA: VCBS repeat-containing protein, partial [Candidatus Acetothermia bacterium]|nr:VCBS repeat-containing protein [Candidatus Acetothermia bacterium]
MRCFRLREKCSPNQVSVLLVLVGVAGLLPGGGLVLGDEVQTVSELPWYLDPSLFPGGTLFLGNQQYSYAPDIMGFAFSDLYMDIVWLHPLLGEDAIKVYAVQGGDFNEDGKLDLIVDVGKRRVGACERGERVHELYLLLNQGGGDFTVAPGYPLVWGCVLSHQPSLFTTADLNQDGHLDVVGVDTDDNYLLLLFGDGRGELELVRQEVPLEVEPENPGFGGVSIGDFNEDGYPDIVISSLYGLVPVMNDGRGRFVRSSDVIVLQEPWPEYGTVGPAAPTSA